jgi:N6-L-threonylcarbamoyladenine synthase
MRILGIESTCDETAAAIVADGAEVLSNVVATQIDLHARYRGVVPEIASRAHIENILPVVQMALDQAKMGLADVDAVAVAYRPGLVGSLLIGVTAAKTLAWSMSKPLIGVDHVHAHLYSVMLGSSPSPPLTPSPCTQGEGRGEGALDLRAPLDIQNHPHPNPLPEYMERGPEGPQMPAVGLVCSGGHTALYKIQSFTDIQLIGSTIDDAVGEAYDKVAAILGLGYPGGPLIDRLAAQGNPKAIPFPRSRLKRDSLDFSFSGLKTAVLYHVRGFQGRERVPASLSEQEIRDVAASFQAACVDVLVEKISRAVRQTGAKSVIIGGGVSANAGLRSAMGKFALPAFFPSMQYCTDNAAMIAGLAKILLDAGRTSGLDLDAITFSEFARV